MRMRSGLDDGYTGRLPTQDLLNNTDGESIILIRDGNGQLNGTYIMKMVS